MSTPNSKNIRNMSGWLYVRPLTQTRFQNVGHVDSFNRNLEVSREPIYASGSGVRTKIDTLVNETNANYSITLRETTALNMALASAANVEQFYTQAAASAVILTGTNARPGELVKLAHIKVTDVTITDGGAGTLSPLVDYTLDAQAGTIEFRTAQTEYDITYDAPAILADERRALISMLSNPEGITCEILVVQKQKRGPKRYRFEGAICTFFPDGDLTLIKEDPGAATITLTGEGIPNEAYPEGQQFGFLVELDNA